MTMSNRFYYLRKVTIYSQAHSWSQMSTENQIVLCGILYLYMGACDLLDRRWTLDQKVWGSIPTAGHV